MKLIKYIALISIGFAACGNAHLEEQKQIDDLLAYLDSGKAILHGIDTGLVYKRIEQIDRHLQLIIKNADSLNKEEAFVIDDYQNCKKYYSKWAVKFPVMFEEMETIPMQLQNLKKDISKNLIKEDKIREYMEMEFAASQSLVETVVEMSDRFVRLNETFLSTEEKILPLIQSLDSSYQKTIEP